MRESEAFDSVCTFAITGSEGIAWWNILIAAYAICGLAAWIFWGFPKFIRSFRKENSGCFTLVAGLWMFPLMGSLWAFFWPIGVFYYRASDKSLDRAAGVIAPAFGAVFNTVTAPDPGRCDITNGGWGGCPVRNKCLYPHMCRRPTDR